MSSIDSRIVKLELDNRQFKQEAKESLSLIEKFKQALNFKGSDKGLKDVQSAAKNFNLNPVSASVDAVKEKFNALGVIGFTALQRITNSAIDTGKTLISALTVDPVKVGFAEYETKLGSIQTILANTQHAGTTLEDVNDVLNDLNTYADKTIYNFQEMTRNIGTFTAAGVGLETSAGAIKGIANLSAMVGSNSEQASRAMYQLSQALATGVVRLQDWMSVENAGLGGKVFQDSLIETARVHGIAIDQMIAEEGSFRDSLQRKWLTSDVLNETLLKFTGDLGEAQLLGAGYTQEQTDAIMRQAQVALEAATKVKTYSQLIDTLKERMGSGWTETWEILIGDFEEARDLFTAVSDTLGGLIDTSATARNELLSQWKELGGRESAIQGLLNIFNALVSVMTPVRNAFREVFPPVTIDNLMKITNGFVDLTSKLALSENASKALHATSKLLFSVLKLGLNVLTAGVKGFAALGRGLQPLLGMFIDLISSASGGIDVFSEWIQNGTLLENAFIAIGSSIGNTITYIGGLIAALGQLLFIELPDLPVSEWGRKVVDSVKIIVRNIADALSGIDPSFESFTNTFEESSSIVQKVAGVIVKGFNIIADGLKAFKNYVSGLGIENLFKELWERLKMFDSEDFRNISLSAGMGVITMSIKKAFDAFRSILFDGEEDITTLSDLLGGFKDVLTAYQKDIEAGTLLKIAGAVAILAAAIFALSHLDAKEALTSLSVVATLFLLLKSVLNQIGEIEDFSDAAGMAALSVSMVGIAAAIGLMAGSLKKIAGMDTKSIVAGLISIAVLLGEMTVAVRVLNGMDFEAGELIKVALAITVFSLGITSLSKAIGKMGNLSTVDFAKGLSGLTVTITEMVLFFKQVSGTIDVGEAKGIAKAVTSLALSLALMVIPIKAMGGMDFWSMAQGLAGLGIVILELGTYMAAMAAIPPIEGKVAALLAVTTSILLLTPIIAALGMIDYDTLKQGLTGLAVVLIELSIAIAALALLPSVGLGASAALLALASSVLVITPAILALGAVPFSVLIQGIIGLAGVFTVLGTAGYLLAPVSPVILALSAALLVMSSSMVVAGAGLGAIATALLALAAIGPVSAAGIVASISVVVLGFTKMIPTILGAIADGLVQAVLIFGSFAPELGMAVAKIGLSILQNVLEIKASFIKTIITFIDALLQTIAAHAPSIIQSGLSIVLALLQGLSSNMQGITEAAVGIVVGFINGISSKMDEIVQAGINLVESFFKAIVGAIAKSTISNDFQMSGVNAIKGFINGFNELASKAIESVKRFASTVASTVKNVLRIASPSKVMIELGEYTGEGFAIGMENSIGNVADVSSKLGDTAIEGLSKSTVSGLSDMDDAFGITGSSMTEFFGDYGDGMDDMEDSIPIMDEATESLAQQEFRARSLSRAYDQSGSSIKKAKEETYDLFKEMETGADVAATFLETFGEGFNFESVDTAVGTSRAAIESFMEATFQSSEQLKQYQNDLAENGAASVDRMKYVQEAFMEMKQGLADNISGQMDMFSEFAINTELTAQELLTNMASNLEGVEMWADGLEALAERGIDQGLLQHLADMGPKGYEYVNAFGQMTDEELQRANELWQQSIVLPDAAATRVMSSFAMAGMGASTGYAEGIDPNAANEQAEALGANSVSALGSGIGASGGGGGGGGAGGGGGSSLTEALGESFVGGFITGVDKTNNGSLQPKIRDIGIQTLNTAKEAFASSKFEPSGKTTMDGVIAGAQAVLSQVQSKFKSHGKTAINEFDSGVKSQQRSSQQNMTTLIQSVCAQIPKENQKFKSSGNVLATNVSDGITEKKDVVIRSATTMIQEANTGMNAEAGNARSVGTLICDGMVDGLASGSGRVESMARRVAREALRAAEDELDINSPSREFRRIGKMCCEGMVVGLDNNAYKVNNSARTMADDVLNEVNHVLDGIGGDDWVDPVIRPVVDLTNVEDSAKRLQTLLSSRTVSTSLQARNLSAIESGMNRAREEKDLTTKQQPVNQNGTQVSFVQNNYSPKALSRIDIYRNTANQISQIERVIKNK